MTRVGEIKNEPLTRPYASCALPHTARLYNVAFLPLVKTTPCPRPVLFWSRRTCCLSNDAKPRRLIGWLHPLAKLSRTPV